MSRGNYWQNCTWLLSTVLTDFKLIIYNLCFGNIFFSSLKVMFKLTFLVWCVFLHRLQSSLPSTASSNSDGENTKRYYHHNINQTGLWWWFPSAVVLWSPWTGFMSWVFVGLRVRSHLNQASCSTYIQLVLLSHYNYSRELKILTWPWFSLISNRDLLVSSDHSLDLWFHTCNFRSNWNGPTCLFLQTNRYRQTQMLLFIC